MGKNKYAHLVPKRRKLYSADDKTFRTLPLGFEQGQRLVEKGYRCLFHGRVYDLLRLEDSGELPKPGVGNLHHGDVGLS